MRKRKVEAATSTLPLPVKPLPGQLPLPFDRDEAARQAALFDAVRDLPGAAEHVQRILWDVEANQ